MSTEKQKARSDKGYSRREFLANTARLAGAALAYPLLSTPQANSVSQVSANTGSSRLAQIGARKVGVLLPASSAYPQLGSSFLTGMRLYQARAQRQNFTLVAADAGLASTAAPQAIEAMLQQERVSLITGMINPGVAVSVAHLLEKANIAFLVTNLGENLPRQTQQSRHIFHHTLDLWQANWALGRWAAGNLGRRAILASSFGDSGYDHLYAFHMGFTGAGGDVLSTVITHTAGDTEGVRAVIDAARNARPDLVFASYYGRPAADLLASYSRAGLRSVPLVGTAYLADDQILRSVGSAALGVKTAFSWAPGLTTLDNLGFTAAYSSATGQAPDAFALLGYETARLVSDALDRSSQDYSILEALASARFTGPRGEVVMDSRTHSTIGPLYLREVRPEGFGLGNAIIGELASLAEQDPQVARLQATDKTGWLSTYLCL